MEDDILNFPSKGQKAFEDFVEDRLKPSSQSSILQPIKKTKAENLKWEDKDSVRER